jgi:predicted nucleic acid-binding protein
MSGNNFLLDTNIVLYLLGGDYVLASIIGARKPHISYITEMELLSSPKLTAGEEIAIKNFLNVCVIADMNNNIKQAAIKLRRVTSLKLPDSIIAATAEFLGVPLLTADSEFNRLKSLNVLQYVR